MSFLPPRTERPPLLLTRWLFLRLLAVAYLLAIVSLWVQLDGLIGSRGILPVADYLDAIESNLGGAAYWRLPTWSWLGASDLALHALCAAGVVLALLLLAGIAQLPALAGLWTIYLSLMHDGQTFLSFQWDILLLEVGFAALFVAPGRLAPRLPWNERPPARAGIWLLRVVLVKLMFLSGVVKLLSMDDTWWNLTALDFHYYTQPLPVWTSWYAHHLPSRVQQLSTLAMFHIEIVAPLLVFGTRWPRLVACGALLLLQGLIAATGSYGFFNLLAAVLCVPLLDDGFLCRLLPRAARAAASAAGPPVGSRHRWSHAALLPPVALLLLLNLLTTVREMSRTLPPGAGARVGAVESWLAAGQERLLSWGGPYLLRYTDPFELVNGYGLFRAMTTSRPEIVVEGSRDGVEWREYAFRWKPGDVARRPRWAAPHQPRLDWQMWFAALNPQRALPWLQRFLLRLLEGEPSVLRLLDAAPFEDGPPRWVRLVYYDYVFTTPDQARSSGDWWVRTRRGELTRPISLETYGR